MRGIKSLVWYYVTTWDTCCWNRDWPDPHCPEEEVRSCYLQKPCIVVLFSQACFCPKIFSQIPSNLHLVSLLMTGRDPGSASCSSGAHVLTWCLTLTCQVSAPSSSPRLCSRHNSSLWPGVASLTSAASPLSRPQQSLALTEKAASWRPLARPQALRVMSASLCRSANWKKWMRKCGFFWKREMSSVFVTMDRNPNS